MPKLRYIGPIDEVELPDGTTVKRNHQVEVTDELAGHGPDEELDAVMAQLAEAVEARDHHLQAQLRAEIAPMDKGEGLLAQVDNWERVTPHTKKKTAAKKAATKKPVGRPVVEPVEPVEAAPATLLINDEVTP